ncbi:MAG: DUF2706 domain-containing protein [Rickettsiaceae bacterium]|nr:DUF2706 domain-containing protein [Rickettsiaceae bacterium]
MRIVGKNLFIIILLLFLLSSCTPSAPYEVKSPCVSNSSDDTYGITPCPRRPVNINYSIV